MRLDNPNLNDCLHSKCMSDTPACGCGYSNETIEHYLMECSTHISSRTKMIRNLRKIIPSITVTPELLMNGDESLTTIENDAIMKQTLDFIKETKRFDKD